MDNFDYAKDSLTRMPLEYYTEQFAQGDPQEMALRCNVDYDEKDRMFSLRIMDRTYTVTHPDFDCRNEDGSICENANIKILILRYLNEGVYQAPGEATITYHDFPWGDTYFRQFEGRCMKRMAYGFGYKLGVFEKAMEKLGAEKLTLGDSAFKVEFMKDLYVYFILWGADDEFDPTCQMLFSDNFPDTFSAEDRVFVCEYILNRLR